MSLARFAANRLWLARGRRAARAYRHALQEPQAAQQRVLFSLLTRNAGSRYGRRFGFARVASVRDYQDRVPVVAHDGLRDEVEAIARGEENVLTCEPVVMLERTTGSSSCSKLVPYTATLMREFQNALAPWMADLHARHPMLCSGGAYWSVSPLAAAAERSVGGLRIGFEEDLDYFEGMGARYLRRLVVTPRGLARLADLETCRYVTLCYLAAAADLRFVSVWHPTFLTLLLDAMQTYAARLIADVARGTLTPPQPCDGALVNGLRPRLRAQPERARQLCALLAQDGELAPRKVWPLLGVISCWASAAAASAAAELASLFPHAVIQPKGLLATEGVVSIPLAEQLGAGLAVTSHFLEFSEDPGGSGRPRLAHELEIGGTYSVLLTTGGGFYRYALGDRVRVVGRTGATPLVDFVCKETLVSDLRGEKLHQGWVDGVLAAAFRDAGVEPIFAMLAPDSGRPPAYALFVECPAASGETVAALAEHVERGLLNGHHYRYCRQLGQLGPLRTFRIRAGGARAYLERCMALGQRPGAVKPTALHREHGWAACFDGDYAGAERTVEAR